MMEEKTCQNNLFDTKPPDPQEPLNTPPLAYRARPHQFHEFKGYEKLAQRYSFLQLSSLPSLIVWGPPGSGKTTLAKLLGERDHKGFFAFSAVLGGLQELRQIITKIQDLRRLFGKESILFIDEIHRFNKAQQDALLPYVEAGEFTLIGATTENPQRSLNRALLSRVQLVELAQHDLKNIQEILDQAQKKFELPLCIGEKTKNYIARYSGGDARYALNCLEALAAQISSQHQHSEPQSKEEDLKRVEKLIHEQRRNYDKNQDRHYDVISAFIKSMRGSDPNATLLWLALMLDGGEDPVFISRRMIIFASEDIGNADPQALPLATATLTAVENIGMPEARINLAHCATYLASTVKSNASYTAMESALKFVQERGTLQVPTHLRNQHPHKKNYQYPHHYPQHFVDQVYAPQETPCFYQPSEMGIEKRIKKRLKEIWKK